MAKRAVDVSAWQGNISVDDWKKVKKSGIECVILRCSYTSQSSFSLHKDKVFDHNIKTAVKAGMKIGIYHYSQAINEVEARKEAQFVLKTIKPYKEHISLPVAFDTEFGGRLNSYVARKMGKQRYKQVCDSFCMKILSAGYTPMVYANLSTLTGYIADDIYKYWLIWVAQYHSKLQYRHTAYMWQYSSSGKVPGLDGRIDMNNLYGQTAVSTPTKVKKYPYELPKLPKRGWFSSGDKGTEVQKLQRFLNTYGDYGLKLDGVVGRKTINAVRHFQELEGLKVDGAFGKECLDRAKAVRI